jgi:transketolase
MRNAFVQSLSDLAEQDERVVLLTGDLGFTVLEDFASRFPDRFFNAGVAEQNMIGVATGMAEGGLVPFVYSIATFASMRGFEFIRNGPVLHDLPVRIVGVGGGMDYGHNGVTHYALEDIGLMRTQPGMRIAAPADPGHARSALHASRDVKGPIYFRLAKRPDPLPELEGPFEWGSLALLGDGDDVALIGLGTLAAEAVAVRDLLAERGVHATVGVLSSVAPAPVDHLAELLSRVPLAVTMEAHYRAGGAGSLVAEVIAERGISCRLICRAVNDVPRGRTGAYDFLLAEHGLAPDQVAAHVLEHVATIT